MKLRNPQLIRLLAFVGFCLIRLLMGTLRYRTFYAGGHAHPIDPRKVRYLYANRLKIPDRTAIEFRPGGHEIFLKGTAEFLKRHLQWPK